MHSPILVFIAGGIASLVAQLLIDLTKLTPAKILVGYVSFGVFLYAVGLYEPLFSLFGAGVSVPLLGFGANIAGGVRDAIDSLGAIGILSGGLSSSSVGITVSLILGLFLSFFFKGRSKRA